VSRKILKPLLITMLITLLIISMTTAFKYSPNVKPHTRFNPLRFGCYYYYGYGSCQVDNANCRGVPIGRNKWVDLGDACNRNKPPTLTGLENITVTETEIVKIRAECIDDNPVSITYSGWTEQAETITSYDDAGEYQETITCTDSFGETATSTITIIIKDKNRAPLFRAMDYNVK